MQASTASTRIATTAFLATLALALAQPVTAQTYDHLKCYKVKDGQKFKAAIVDLAPLDDPPFTLEAGCKLKGKAKKLCVPVDKTVQETDAGLLPVAGEEAAQ